VATTELALLVSAKDTASKTLDDVQKKAGGLGKVLGGGMPLGAFGGRADLMQLLAPVGPVYQAGTLSGNPISVAAGLATLETLAARGDAYARLEELGSLAEHELREAIDAAGVPGTIVPCVPSPAKSDR